MQNFLVGGVSVGLRSFKFDAILSSVLPLLIVLEIMIVIWLDYFEYDYPEVPGTYSASQHMF